MNDFEITTEDETHFQAHEREMLINREHLSPAAPDSFPDS